ncbi:MAG: 2-oxo acid dehydrogenase subunit E2, partial [Burkholderiaceae bacterium]
MAIVEIKVPQLSESVAEATLLQWKKKVGQAVTGDEILIEVETDKVVLEVPAPAAGVLTDILAGDGATVAAGQLIARIDTEAAAAVAIPVTSTPSVAAVSSGASMAGFAMPAAAKIMAENELAPAGIAGTGRDGRITKADAIAAVRTPPTASVAAHLAQRPTEPAALPQVVVAPPSLGERPEQRVPMSRLRARVAERLLQSQSSSAILTTFNEVNMAPVIDMRKRFQEKFEKEHGVKIGFMSFFVKAAVHALKKYPVLNASVDGNDIVYHGFFD